MTASEQIIQVLDALCEKFGIVIDWTSESVMPYIKLLYDNLINYKLVSSIALIAILITLSIAYTLLVTKIFIPKNKQYKENGEYPFDMYSSDWDVIYILIVVACILLCVATIIITCVQIFDIIKCMTFPEMYVFEYVKEFAKDLTPYV